MTKLIQTICILSLLSVFACQPESEWNNLFNGENLEGWEILGAEESNFYVEDGILVAETKMGLPNTFLATEKHYSDFELETEFKVNEGMNTGIQYRSSQWEKDTIQLLFIRPNVMGAMTVLKPVPIFNRKAWI